MGSLSMTNFNWFFCQRGLRTGGGAIYTVGTISIASDTKALQLSTILLSIVELKSVGLVVELKSQQSPLREEEARRSFPNDWEKLSSPFQPLPA
jgi:hypothetical protein